MSRKCLFIVLLGFAGLALGGTPEPIEKIVGLRVSVDAKGQIESTKPTNTQLPEALNKAADELARKLRFTPAKLDGQAVSSETTLYLTLRLQAKPEGGFSLHLVNAQNGPLFSSLRPPMYPTDLDAHGVNGRVVAVVAINADGKPDLAALTFDEVKASSGGRHSIKAFRDAVTASLAGTRFEMDLVDGRPIPHVVRIPYGFCSGRSRKEACSDFATDAKPQIRLAQIADGAALPQVAFTPPAETPAGG